jgi:hypothetical protein
MIVMGSAFSGFKGETHLQVRDAQSSQSEG